MATVAEALNMRNKIDVAGKIQNCGESRNVNLKVGGTTQVMEADLVDSTGTIKIALWGDDIKRVKNGSEVEIKNGYTNVFKGKATLGKGKFGTINVKSF